MINGHLQLNNRTLDFPANLRVTLDFSLTLAPSVYSISCLLTLLSRQPPFQTTFIPHLDYCSRLLSGLPASLFTFAAFSPQGHLLIRNSVYVAYTPKALPWLPTAPCGPAPAYVFSFSLPPDSLRSDHAGCFCSLSWLSSLFPQGLCSGVPSAWDVFFLIAV